MGTIVLSTLQLGVSIIRSPHVDPTFFRVGGACLCLFPCAMSFVGCVDSCWCEGDMAQSY